MRKLTKKQPRQDEDRAAAISAMQQLKNDTTRTKMQIHMVPSTPDHLREPPPQLELPIDIRSSPFSKATYSPPSSPPALEKPRLRRVRAVENMSPPAFRLMDLPTELRLSILGHYFGHRTVAINLPETKARRNMFFSLVHQERKLNIVALMQTCRRLSNEAIDILWTSTTFVVKISDYLPLGRPMKPAVPLHKIRHAVLNIGFLPNALPRDFTKVIAAFTNLKTVDVHFDFTALKFMLPSMGDWIVEEVVTVLKTEKVGKASCVSYGDHCLVPYQSPAFEELVRRYQA